jgi:hypothetical protein
MRPPSKHGLQSVTPPRAAAMCRRRARCAALRRISHILPTFAVPHILFRPAFRARTRAVNEPARSRIPKGAMQPSHAIVGRWSAPANRPGSGAQP